MEARIRQAENFAWAVPALALTAQAFILNVALDTNAQWGGRSIAAFSGAVILLAALHLLGKHSLNFDVFEAVIDRERDKLGLPPVSRNALLGLERGKDGKLNLKSALREVDTFPTNTGFRDRDWLGLYLGDKSPERGIWVRLRRWLVFKGKAVIVWAVALGLLAVMDLAVALYLVICRP